MKSNILAALSALVMLCCSANSFSQTVAPLVYTPDWRVHDLASKGDTLIVAGDFSHVGKYTGGMALFTTTSDQPDAGFPKMKAVISSTADGNGGFYALVLDYDDEYKIVHILPNYTIDPNFSIPALGIMVVHRSIIYHNGIIYVGGINMSSGYGAAAGELIAFNAATQQLVNNIPHVNGEIKNMRIHNNTLYVMGDFTQVESQSRNGIAAIDLTSHTVKPWYPANSPCLTALGESYTDIVFYGSQAVIGTWLTDNCAVGMPSTYKIVITDTISGAVNRYLLDNCGIIGSCVNGGVYWAAGVQKIAIDGSRLYVYTSGTFDTRLTVMDLTNNDAVLWTRYFNMIAQVSEIAVSGNSVFLAGWNMNEIYTLNTSNDDTADIEQKIHNAVKLDAATGAIQDWHPVPVGLVTNDVWTMTLNGSDIFLGGNFSHVNGLQRPSVYMVNTATEEVLPFKIEAYFLDVTNAIKLVNNTLYLAGDWSSAYNPNYPAANRTVRAFNFSTGAELPLNIGYLGKAHAMDINDNYLFIAGDISDTTGGQTRTKLIAIDRNTNEVLSWAPNPDWDVYALHISGNILYVGGDFNTIAGQSRKHIAAFDATTLQLLPWTADSVGDVRNIKSNDSVLFVTQPKWGNHPHPYGYAGLSKTDGSIMSRPHDPDHIFSSADLVVRNNTVLVGSADEAWLDTAYCSIRSYNGNTTDMQRDSNFCLNVTGYTNAVVLIGNDLFFGGAFDFVNGQLWGTNLCKVSFPHNYFNDEDPVPTTVRENVAAQGMLLYPNPAGDKIYIRQASSKAIASVYNALGVSMLTFGLLPNSERQIDISHLPPGLYVVIIQLPDGEKQIKKFIKQ